MSDILELRLRYRGLVESSFNKQDHFTVDKARSRSKKILPRGRVYHKMVMCMLNAPVH